MTWDSGVGLDITQKAVDAFQKKFPNITVELQSVPQGYDESHDRQRGRQHPGRPLDVEHLQFAEAGVAENLSPYIARDKYDMKKFLPVLKAWTEYKGKVGGFRRTGRRGSSGTTRRYSTMRGSHIPGRVDVGGFHATVKKPTNGKPARRPLRLRRHPRPHLCHPAVHLVQRR